MPACSIVTRQGPILAIVYSPFFVGKRDRPAPFECQE